MIIITAISTVLLVFWFVLLFAANQDDQLMAAKGQLLANRLAVRELERKAAENAIKLETQFGLAKKVMGLIWPVDQSKEITRLKKKNAEIKRGNLRSVWGLDLPGYVLMRWFPGIISSNFYKKIRSCYYELYGKKNQDLQTKQLVAKIFSYPIIGTAVSMVAGQIIMMTMDTMIGIAVMIIGPMLVVLLSYAQFDDLNDLVLARRDKILRQIPNVLSKLALLATSGMIMDRAWRETAFSSDGELYIEMRTTADELSNLKDPVVAYSGFIDRCNTKETTKLASAIIQNLEKGNAEIAILLQQMAKDSWNERRNLAKRDSENANSKLMIPTMMLFGVVMIMILVPIAMSLNGGL